MTYCAAVMLDAGIVMASDSRTNAGVDNIATFRKMKIMENPGERALMVVSSGNLAVTQATLNHLDLSVRRGDGGPNIMNVSSMYEVAELIGNALREVRRQDGPYLQQSNVDGSASFIIGGQIAGERVRLFMVYSEGNFIEATDETPYLQIGEVKYGKPIIMINSCRYDLPFCWSKNYEMLQSYKECLKRLDQNGLLIAVSNNKADQEYTRIGCGIQTTHIPSLCAYTGIRYSPTRNTFLGWGNLPEHPLITPKSKLGSPYKWSDISTFKGIVVIPYEISTMSMFEFFSGGMPMFFPSKQMILHHYIILVYHMLK